MRRVRSILIITVVILFSCHLTAEAEELKLYRLEEKTEIKEQMSVDSETIATLEEGTPVLYLEQEEGWIKIRYQDYEGYVSLETKLTDAVPAKEMEEEFKAVGQEFDGVYQGIALRQRQDKQETVWKLVILVLAVLVIGSYASLGIAKQRKKKKDQKEKEEKE